MTTVFKRVWRRYWPFNFLAIVVLVVVVAFASFLHGAQVRQREGTCAILDRLPANIDPGVDRARALYDCGAPTPPILFFGHPFPTPTSTVKPHHITRAPGTTSTTVVTVPGHTASPSKPSPRLTASHTPAAKRPLAAPTPKPTPKPASSTCVPGVLCVGLLPQS